ncbi:hypothetical protein SUGI_0920370 [Cryptomeria japonica]|nr:hypothetical protein SUGI_0920370 [Cryptomeria japonica]
MADIIQFGTCLIYLEQRRKEAKQDEHLLIGSHLQTIPNKFVKVILQRSIESSLLQHAVVLWKSHCVPLNEKKNREALW